MPNVVLKKVRLVNWYGFADTTIDFAESVTYITGRNYSGKSTILDAIKYALNGDTMFNKASEGNAGSRGHRTLEGYTRCLINPEKQTYLRDKDKYPTFYTHIQLEYLHKPSDHSFVIGCVIKTTVGGLTSLWYATDDKTLKDVDCTGRSADNKKIVFSDQDLRKKYDLKLWTKEEGLPKTLRMQGLPLTMISGCRNRRCIRKSKQTTMP